MSAEGSLTVIATVSESVRRPSDTVKVTLYVPACVDVGVQLKILVAGVNVAPLGRFVAEYVSVLPFASVADIVNCNAAPSLTVLLPIAASTGAAFVGAGGAAAASTTVMVIFSESLKLPSDTLNVT